MRDLGVIDSELQLLLAIRRMVREAEGRPPSTAPIERYWTSGRNHPVRI